MKQKAPDLEMDVDEQVMTVGEALEEMDRERKVRRRKRVRSSLGSEAEVREGTMVQVQQTEYGPVDGPSVDAQEYDPEEITGDDIREAWQDFNDEYYCFIPAPPLPPFSPSVDEEAMVIDEDNPPLESGSTSRRIRATTSIRLDDDEDTRVVEEANTGGKVIKMGDVLYKRWKEHFDEM